MPWSNQGGNGGPWGGNNNKGPWGQGPNGPRGPQNTPPDLEDIIRKGQDRLKNALPRGSGTPALFGLIGAGLLALWVFQCIYTVQPDELGVELRFGKMPSLAEMTYLDAGNVEALADRLGVGPRHLRRLFDHHLGASPQSVAVTRRLPRPAR